MIIFLGCYSTKHGHCACRSPLHRYFSSMASSSSTNPYVPAAANLSTLKEIQYWEGSASDCLENCGFDVRTNENPTPLFRGPISGPAGRNSLHQNARLSHDYKNRGAALVEAFKEFSEHRWAEPGKTKNLPHAAITQDEINKFKDSPGRGVSFEKGNYTVETSSSSPDQGDDVAGSCTPRVWTKRHYCG